MVWLLLNPGELSVSLRGQSRPTMSPSCPGFPSRYFAHLRPGELSYKLCDLVSARSRLFDRAELRLERVCTPLPARIRSSQSLPGYSSQGLGS